MASTIFHLDIKEILSKYICGKNKIEIAKRFIFSIRFLIPEELKDMINEKEKKIIISYAKKFGVKEVYLFGSSIDNKTKTNDIDLAVNGISPIDFFDFYGKLLRFLPKSVDLVNLSKKNRFTKMVQEQAVKIYG